MAKVKRKEYENLSDENIKKVIFLLESPKPITKKDACSRLKIAYNTNRLQRIIEEYKERQEYIAKQKAKRSGKKATKVEIQEAITEYLNGENYSTIAKGLFRSSGFIRGIIERVGVPQRPTRKDDRTRVECLPDTCLSEEFSSGEIVWSAKYHRPAKVIKEVDNTPKYLGKVYQIYVIEEIDSSESLFPHVMRGGFNAYQPAYDLGKLEHLEKYGIDLHKI
jgi:hypothetical protein